jgi:hypothetical protein
MDSNFQVTINANVQGLRSAIKEAQSTLSQFDKSVGGAASSTKALEREANRGRLAAFAFGQVIRDAGFFSQSFGLGLLAISNNIPILIDQLVLLSGVSAGVGSALSLLGSILTAALTIWAYSSSAVDKNKKSIDEWRNSLEDTTEVQLRGKQAALDEVTSLEMLYRAATNVTNSNKTRYAAAKQLQEQYPTTFANLSAEEIALGKNENAYNGLRDSIIGAAMAEAAKDKIVANASRILDNNTKIIEARSASIKAQTELLAEQAKTAGADPNRVRVSTGATPGSVAINADAEKSFARQAVLKKELADLDTIIYNSISDTNILTGRNNNLWVEAGKYTKDFVDNLDAAETPIANIGKETLIVDTRLNKVTDTLNRYYDKLKDIQLTAGITPLEVKKGSAEALGDLIVNLQKIAGTERTVALLTTEFNKLNGELKFAKNFGPITFDIDADPAIKSLNDFNAAVTGILQSGIIDAISSTFMGVGDAISRSGNIADAAGAGFLNSIANIAQQLGELAIGVGIGIKAIKAALESLNPVVAIAAGVALLTLAGYARSRASAISGSNGGGGSSSSTPSGGTFGGVRPFASGGIVSGPTNALIGEYPGARSNPEVVAPLDKLTKIIGGSIGGGDMGGQLSARISGNDLVILLDRASKNRKNYF